MLAAVLSAWLQYAADGQPHVRALVTQTCPPVTFDGGTAPMEQRAGTSPGFDDVVCDTAIPPNVSNIRVENVRLPAPASNPRTVVVFGDTGCRMKDEEQQNCGDIADWPFPKIAQTIAAVRPDLLVHVGDYYYRESNCMKIMKACVNRWGDTSLSWDADWFWPARPLFATAPLVLARGNHEECARGGAGWFRYLDGSGTMPRCTANGLDGTPPWAVSFDGLRLVLSDSAADPSDTKPTPARIAFYENSFRRAQQLADGATGDVWFVTHRPPYVNMNETQALLALDWQMAPFGLVLAGHVHDFEAINLARYAPIVINGEGGDDLDDAGEASKEIGAVTNNGHKVYTFAKPAPYSTKQFGFAVYTKTEGGWNISLRDVDGIGRRACVFAKGTVSCP